MKNSFEVLRHWGWTSALVMALLATSFGCAYFNLFYNAEKSYGEAERIGREVDPRNQPTSQQRSEYQKAIRKCKLLLDEYPNSDLVDDALFLIGKSHFRMREWSEAIRHFGDVLNNFPGSDYEEEAMYLLSLCHLGRGEEDVALQWLARLRESYPEGELSGAALFELGDIYVAAERYERAEQSYLQFLEAHADRPEAQRVRVALAKARLTREDPVGAVEALEEFDVEKAAKTDGDLPFEAESLRIVGLLGAGRAEDALGRLPDLDASARNPEHDRRAKLLRGRVSLEIGSIEDGVAILNELATEAQAHEEGTEARAVAIAFFAEAEGPESKDYRQQVFAASEVKRLLGDRADEVRAEVRKLSRYLRVREAYDKADSTAGRRAFELGELVMTDYERSADAVEWYEKALEIEPEAPFAPRALYALGWIQRTALGDADASAQWFDDLARRFPESPQARSLAGEVFVEAKPRTREELEAMILGVGPGVGPGGEDVVTDPRMDPRRSLRFGGPGASGPRERRSG